MENKQILDTYTILEPIGSGSGGTVFKAYHTRLEQLVVLKRLNNPRSTSLDKRKEVDILKKLKHSFLPQVLDFIEMENEVYTVMSFIPGKSFLQLLKEGRRFSRQELLKWGMEICSALNYLHTQRIPIIHGDIKPSNLMLTPEGDICLIDFNISFYLDENTVLGYTDGYTSPEQYLEVSARRRKNNTNRYVINEQSDIYSTGATLYHLATGKKHSGYKEEMDFNLLAQILGEPFASVIQKAVNVEPGERYATAMEMFRALQAIPKKDQRYRRMLRAQQLRTVILCGMLVGFLCLGGYGFSVVQQARYDAYDDIVEDQTAYIEARDFSEAAKKFEEASDKIPSQLETYYQNAYALYRQGQYTQCREFINSKIIKNKRIKENRERMVDVYALQGLVDMELGDTQAAVEDYKKAITAGAFDNKYYRDYAVALAHNGQAKQAQDVLKDASGYGLDDGSIHYTKGEIHAALQETDDALEEFSQCIENTEDTYMQMRAFVMKSKIYEERQELSNNREVLLQAKKTLPVQDQMIILERLVQADIDLAEDTGDSSYRWEAIEILGEIIDNKWAVYDDYDTLAVLYQKEGELERAASALQTMGHLFGEDYNIYKRYGFLEIQHQNALPQEYRDYSQFLDYYNRAQKLYYEQLKDNHTDTEMDLLTDMKNQVETGGWI